MDSVSTALVVSTDFSMLSLFIQADIFVKSIMFLLLFMSIATWAILFAKYGMFRGLKNKARHFEEAFWNDEGLQDLYKYTAPEDTDHPMAMLYVVGLREWDRAKDKESIGEGTFQIGATERIHQFMFAKMNRELERLEKSLPLLATIGSTAPFIGLLGTVWGIMNSFQSIGATKNTSLAVVAPGIAEALLATALGLFAAIPAVVAYNKLSTELGRYAGRLESFVNEFVSLMDRQNQESLHKIKKTVKRRRKSDANKEVA